MTDFGTSTNFTESVNICLMALGERAITSVSSLTPAQGQSTIVNLCVRILDEVNKDVEARGWWFQTTRGDIIGVTAGTPAWNASHPEEFRRYVTIRAARILQTRYITDETLHKLTLEEEMYSKAVLEAKDAEQDSSVTFALPQEIENLGIRGVMFLQSNLEEKLATLKLGTELAQTELLKAQELKTDSEKALIDAQELLIDQQKLTEVQETAKRAAEVSLLADQEDLVEQQVLTEVQETAKRTAEKDLLVAQELKVDQETAKTTAEAALIADQEDLIEQQVLTEVQETAKRTAEKDLVIAQDAKTDAETALIADQEALVTQQTLTEVEETAKRTAEKDLLVAQELKVDQETAKTTAETALIVDQEALVTQQTLTEVEETAKRTAEKDLLVAQELKVDQETAKVTAETALITDQEALVTQQKLTEVEETAKRTAEKELLVAQELKVDQETAKTTAETALIADQEALVTQQTLTEAQQTAKVTAETALITDQEALVTQQTLTEVQETAKRAAEKDLVIAQDAKTDAETTLTTKQGDLVDAQELKTDAEKLLVDAQTALTADQELKTVSETALLDSQKTKLDAETAYMITAEKNWFDTGGVDISGTVRSYKDFRPEMRIMGIQEAAFQSLPAYKKVELIKDAVQLRSDRSVTSTLPTLVGSVNKVLRMLGVTPVSTNTNEHALASEAKELLEDTDLELQARGWWFNTEKDVTFTITAGKIVVPTSTQLYEELDDYDTTRVLDTDNSTVLLQNLKDNTTDEFSGTIKGTRIVKRSITYNEVPPKYRQYLEVKVAAILAELYPQSGSEIQRIRKLEAELESYFKDRENDQGNYNIFDNYDTNERIGFNRNYDLN